MDGEAKNKISHRYKALALLREHLEANPVNESGAQ